MEIPNNSLTKEIKKIVKVCDELAEDYGDDASWFDPPTTEEQLTAWEKENGIKIPKSYKEWLRFSGSSQIRETLARFYGVKEMEVDNEDIPKDYVVIGELIGDGEMLCFSKSTGIIIRYNHGEIEELDSFKDILQETIRMCKEDSNELSQEAEAILFAGFEEWKKEKNNGSS